MRLRPWTAFAFVSLAACSSHHDQPTAEFGGSYTTITAFFEAVVPSSVRVTLFGEQVACGDWQSSPFTGDYIEVDVNDNDKGTYNTVGPNVATAGQAAAAAYLGNDGVTSTSGSFILSQISTGSVLSGSGDITWNDGESVTIEPFTASYCSTTITPAADGGFDGTLSPLSAFFDTPTDDASAPQFVIYALSQTMDCNTWQQTSPPVNGQTMVLELDVYTTNPNQATYSIVEYESIANSTSTAIVTFGLGQSAPEMDAATGTLSVSALDPSKNVTGSAQIEWNDGTSLQVNNFTATYCPLPNGFKASAAVPKLRRGIQQHLVK